MRGARKYVPAYSRAMVYIVSPVINSLAGWLVANCSCSLDYAYLHSWEY